MRFSVIIPTFNEEAYIERCACSVLQQSYDRASFEIILSDANSSDRTRDLARHVVDKTVVTQERGIALGRNKGAEVAAGDILVFVDADAELAPNVLSLFENAFSDPLVVGATAFAKPSDGGLPQRLVYRGTYFLVRFFWSFGLSLFPGICVAYRKSPFIAVSGFREDFGIVEDLDLSRRIARQGRTTFVKDARVFVSTRRLERHLASTVFFHIVNDIRYLLTGRAGRRYPKKEEVASWKDLWKGEPGKD
jgi:glycosyltransferase involved in cell wall biosynthesis